MNQAHPLTIVIGLGLLDVDLAEFPPTDEFFCANKTSWVAGVEGSAKAEFMPRNRGQQHSE